MNKMQETFKNIESIVSQINQVIEENKRLQFHNDSLRARLLLACLECGAKGFINASNPLISKVDWAKITEQISSNEGFGFALTETLESIKNWQDVPLKQE